MVDVLGPNATLLWDRPVVGELQRHLEEGVRTQVVLLGKLRAEPLEVEHVDVEVVDQSVEENPNRF